MPNPFVIGWDAGQVNDPSAVVGLERRLVGDVSCYDLHALTRLALGMPYYQQIDKVRSFIQQSGATPTLGVDVTGAVAFKEQVYAANLPAHIQPVWIVGSQSGGATWNADLGQWNVPKVALVSLAIVMVESARSPTPRLRVPRKVAEQTEWRQLVSELQAFKSKMSKAGNESFGNWRDSDHDDLVLALAIGLWIGENTPIGWDGSIGSATGHDRDPTLSAPDGVFGDGAAMDANDPRRIDSPPAFPSIPDW